jgi:hypothetical protein
MSKNTPVGFPRTDTWHLPKRTPRPAPPSGTVLFHRNVLTRTRGEHQVRPKPTSD